VVVPVADPFGQWDGEGVVHNNCALNSRAPVFIIKDIQTLFYFPLSIIDYNLFQIHRKQPNILDSKLHYPKLE